MQSRKLIVKRLPRKVCISVRTTKGRTLAKTGRARTYRRRTKSRRRGRRRKYRRSRKGGSLSKCLSRRKSRATCERLSRNSCLTRRGTTKRTKLCRSLARHRGLRAKTHRGRRRRSALSSQGTFFGQSYKAWGDLLAP